MNITEVRIFKIDDDTKTKGIASITIDNEFVVGDIKIIGGQKGLFVSMPSRKRMDGEYKDICYPITTEAREQIQEAILTKYNENKDEVRSDLPF